MCKKKCIQCNHFYYDGGLENRDLGGFCDYYEIFRFFTDRRCKDDFEKFNKDDGVIKK